MSRKNEIIELLKQQHHDYIMEKFFGKKKNKPRREPELTEEQKIAKAEQEETDRAMAYWVRTGDVTLLNDLSRRRQVDAFFRDRWD